MQSETTTAITAVKQDVRLREWAEQLEAQQASGLTVPQWCVENSIKTKSFYYRLRKVREQYIRSAQAVVPLTVPQQQSADIRIAEWSAYFTADQYCTGYAVGIGECAMLNGSMIIGLCGFIHFHRMDMVYSCQKKTGKDVLFEVCFLTRIFYRPI